MRSLPCHTPPPWPLDHQVTSAGGAQGGHDIARGAVNEGIAKWQTYPEIAVHACSSRLTTQNPESNSMKLHHWGVPATSRCEEYRATCETEVCEENN